MDVKKYDSENIKSIETFLAGSLDESSFNLYNKLYSKPILEINTPFYIIDSDLLYQNFHDVSKYFHTGLSNGYYPFYPIKINNHIYFSKTAVQCKYGLEVASMYELKQAISCGAKKIIYYAPGKKESDLEYILSIQSDHIQIHIDNFTDLKILGNLSNKTSVIIKIGVRLSFDFYDEWSKYGINIEHLRKFFNESKQYKNLIINGFHFHTSRNKTPHLYTESIKALGYYLKNNFSYHELEDIEYLDIGGGFEKNNIEGFYEKEIYGETNDKYNTYILKACSLENYIQNINFSIDKYLNPLFHKKIDIYSELGRYITSDAMHIVSSVVDVKQFGDIPIIILDAGVNLVGRQRGLYEYFPIINISNYGKKQKRMNIVGNLCTTRDIWGFWCYSKELPKIGDIIVLGNQGCLTYSLAQNFINPIANVYVV